MTYPDHGGFTALIGSDATIEQTDIRLRVTTVDESPSGGFSVLLRGPDEPMLEQATYPVLLGSATVAVPIFLVPIAAGAEGVTYEAVFTQAPNPDATPSGSGS